jgi:hypothetical protein
MKVAESGKTWVAMASGLSMGAQEAPADLKAEMMVEWLTGEAGGLEVCYFSPGDESDKAGPTRGRTYSSIDTSWKYPHNANKRRRRSQTCKLPLSPCQVS